MTKPQFYLQAASGVMNPIDPGYDVSSIDPGNVWVPYTDHKAEIERLQRLLQADERYLLGQLERVRREITRQSDNQTGNGK